MSTAFDKFRAMDKKSSTKMVDSKVTKSNEKNKEIVDSEITMSEAQRSTSCSNSSSSSSLQHQPPAKRAKNLVDEITEILDSGKSKDEQQIKKQQPQQQLHQQSNKLSGLKQIDSRDGNQESLQTLHQQQQLKSLKSSELRKSFFSNNNNNSATSKTNVNNEQTEKSENVGTKNTLVDKTSNVTKAEPLQKSATTVEKPGEKLGLSETALKSASCTSMPTTKIEPVLKGPNDVYTKGACSSLKTMFEEHIAVKKGLKPDPALPQGDPVKVRTKVRSDLPAGFKLPPEKKDDHKKESIFVDKIIFKKFLGKFEDDQSREQAKAQLRNLTQAQKGYTAKWTERQEEQKRKDREEEERRLAAEEAKRIQAEQEAKRIREEEEERLRKEEEQKRREAEEAEARAKKEAKKAAALAKKQARQLGKQQGEQANLPRLVSSTYTDLKKRFQTSPKEESLNSVQVTERPKVRKLMDNPFETKKSLAEDADKKSAKSLLPSNQNQNRISEMKKRYSQLFNSTTNVMVGTLGGGQEKESEKKSVNKVQDSAEPMQVDQVDSMPSEQEMTTPKEPKEEMCPTMAEKPKISLLRRSKEHLDRSCEKLLKYSKEKLNEISGNGNAAKSGSSKPSKDDMQSYLLSHVLYDGQKTVANTKKEPDWLDTLDEDMELEKGMFEDEYIKEMEKYLALFDSDDKKGKKKKTTKKKSKTKEAVEEKEPAVKLVTVEVSDLKKMFEKAKPGLKLENKPEPQKIDLLIEPNVDKFKELFEASSSDATDSVVKTQAPLRRPGRLLSQDILRKFDSPEMAEELKREREKEREERRLQRIAKLEEEKRKAEEERKRKEEEMKRIEKERQEALRREEEERIRLEEEEKQRQIEEHRAKVAYEEMLKVEKEKAALREKREAQTKEQREKNEPAFKKRKVLDRIQHVFEKNMEEDQSKKVGKIGSITGKAEELFSKDENLMKRKNFQDPSLSGISSVLNKVKDRFEIKDAEPMTLSHGVSIKKKNIPGAETFALIELKQQKENLATAALQRQNSSNAEEWSWKKKDPKQLAIETTIAMYGASKEPQKKSDREKKKLEQQQQLISEVKTLSSRLVKRDALKEHEEKMKEYASFMEEIQDYLKEPVISNEEKSFKDDIQNYIQLAAATANKKKLAKKKIVEKSKPVSDLILGGSIAEIKLKLKEQSNYFESPKMYNNDGGSASIAQLIGSLQQKSESNVQNNYQSKLFDVEGNAEVSKIRDKFENETNESGEEIETKSSYEWKYKKKSIMELQKYLYSHGHLIPASVSKTLSSVERNLVNVSNDEQSIENEKGEQEKVDDYNQFMEKVDQFLNAPDKSSEEIDFKTEIEKYLDLIEEPANEEEKKEQQNNCSTAKISRKPQKLNLTNLVFDKSESDDVEKNNLLSPRQKDSKFIKDMQQRLVGELTKEAPKEEVVIHTVGTNRLTKEYEKLGKAQEIVLLTAPKLVPKKTAEELAATVSTNGPIESKQNNSTSWKWKQKDIAELYHHIKENYEVVPPAILEQQKNLLEAETSLERERATLANDSSMRSVQMLQKLEEDRDRELDNFLNDVQQFLGKETKLQTSSSVGKLIQKQRKDNNEVKTKALELTGTVSSIRSFLENQNSEEVNDDSTSNQDKPKIGKVKTDFLLMKNQEKEGLKFIDPVISSLDASRIKKKLVNQCYNDEPKTLFSAPKTKLVDFIPKEDKLTAVSELGGLLRQKRQATGSTKVTTSEKIKSSTSSCQTVRDELPKPEYFPPFTPIAKPKEEPISYKSPYAHIKNEEERKAAILAKYGVKPRPLKNASSSSSLSSEEDEKEIAKKISEEKEKLKAVYGLNDIKERRREKRQEQQNAGNSLHSLRNVLAKLRDARAVQSNSNLAEYSSNEAMQRSGMDLSEIKGTCSNARAIFERQRLSSEGESTHRESQFIEKSATFSNVKNLFDTTDSPTQQSPRHSGLYNPASNRSFSNVKKVFESSNGSNRDLSNCPSNVFSPSKRQENNIERSSSFHKFLGAFEAGKAIRHKDDDDESYDDSSDDDSDNEQTPVRGRIVSANAGSQKSLIQAELDEIRNSSRNQSIFRINRPSSNTRPSLMTKYGNSSENLDLDSETLQQVSSTRSAMVNMFESSAPKVTFGGAAAFGAEKATVPKPQQKPQAADNSERGWMFDVINKYFDVIVEDEEESEEEEEDDDEEYDDEDEIEEHEPVFATQVVATHQKYPAVLEVQEAEQLEEESDYDSDHEDLQEHPPVYASQVSKSYQRYLTDDVMDQQDPEEDEDEESESGEEEEESEQEVPQSYGIARSASSSRMRSLFRTVVQRNLSGSDLRLEQFKANLGSHLRLRGSTQSLAMVNHPVRNQDESASDNEAYEETAKYYRVPL